jgi:hypothetical protein
MYTQNFPSVIFRTESTRGVEKDLQKLEEDRPEYCWPETEHDDLDQLHAEHDCPARKPPFLAVKRPARPYKTAIRNRFTLENAKAA